MAIFGAASVRCGGANGSHGCQSSKLELSQDARSVARVKILKRSIGWFEIFWSRPLVSRCHDRQADYI